MNTIHPTDPVTITELRALLAGWLVARELRWALDTDWRLADSAALSWRLVAEVETLAAQAGSERRCAASPATDTRSARKPLSVALRAPHGGTAGEVHQ